jgi:uracil-DNA glycosylase
MTDIWYGTSGPRDARIVIVGEAWGVEELAQQKPFVGNTGFELTRLLSESGIDRAACFLTNVIADRPRGNEMWRFFHPSKGANTPPLRGLHPSTEILASVATLHEQIRRINPKLVIACGNYALWALTNVTKFSTPSDTEGRRVPSGIDSWRGSMWYCDSFAPHIPCLPIYHPAALFRAWYLRAPTLHDLRERVPMALRGDWRPPAPDVIAPPTYAEAIDILDEWLGKSKHDPLRLVSDIETHAGLMTCIGFAPTSTMALTIPFIRPLGRAMESYWSHDEEFAIVSRIRRLFLSPRVAVIGQNFLYDTQYILAFLGVLPRIEFDTMLAHHLLFPGTPKGLDYLSSLYCKYHWFWKDDGKDWDLRGDLDAHLKYNALDCLRTFEVAEVLRGLIDSMGQAAQWREELEGNELALRMMLRGIRIDSKRRAMYALELATARDDLAKWLTGIIPQEWITTKGKTAARWFDSTTQQRQLFGETLGMRIPLDRKTKRPTLGKEGMASLRQRHPEFMRLFEAMRDYDSLGVFYNTFVKAPLDHDSRMRCMFNTSGTETFRWSSSKNAFGSGTNLQNIPSGNED